MNREETKALIESLVESHKAGENARLQAAKAIGCRPENPLFDAMSQMETIAIKAVSKLIGDDGEWLDWFIWENDCGSRGMKCSAGYGPNLMEIHSVDDLLDARTNLSE
jgi:hypothetical protein